MEAIKTPDSVEKMLLGATPDDEVAVRSGSPGLVRDPRATRLDSVRRFLEDQPALRAQLGKEVEDAWRSADGRRGAFLTGLAERRAQLLSMAELGQLREQASRAAADAESELARYLREMEGFGV
jgi:hypothetical protein